MDPVTLYQFELCPFCHKVRAGLELKGIPFRTVEVNPMTKKELPALPDGPRKVPVLRVAGDTVTDSTAILAYLEEKLPGKMAFTPEDAEARKLSVAIEDWVDTDFTVALPTVIYGTWSEALKAAQVTAKASNFGFFQNVGVRAGGSLVMHQVAKRILKKNGRTDAHRWVEENVDEISRWLAGKEFLTGSAPSLGDVAVHGAMSCVEEFPIFQEFMKRPDIAAWFTRMRALRVANRAS